MIFPKQVQFEDTFGEPEGGARSIDCCWKCTYCCFNCTLSCCYKFLTIFFSVPAAFMWACEFACVVCCHVWCYTPLVKDVAISAVPVRKLIWIYLDTYLGPCCEVMGLCFSRIKVENK